MSQGGMILTSAGHELLAKALTGKELHFTRAYIGDGELRAGQDIYQMTGLISPKKEMPIQSMDTNGLGTCEIVLEVTNKDLREGFFVREYGIYAQDPDTNKEILYSYANKGNECGYLEAQSSSSLVNYTLSLITVISQATNVTAEINTSNAYVTTTKLDARFYNLYAEGVTPAGFWTYAPEGDDRIRPVDIETVKHLILGRTNVESIVSRLERLEDNLAEVLLSQEMAELYPGYTHYLVEDFRDRSQLDDFSSAITGIVAGDDSIDSSPITGIIPGSNYYVTDGSQGEHVQVRSVNLENGVQRIILSEKIKNTYDLSKCRLYRCEQADDDRSEIITISQDWYMNIKQCRMTVKHNPLRGGSRIRAYVSVRPAPVMVKGEHIGIGSYSRKTYQTAHYIGMRYDTVKVYYDGVKQERGYEVNAQAGRITCSAPEGVIITCDYEYGYEPEIWQEMEMTKSYSLWDYDNTEFRKVIDGVNNSYCAVKLVLETYSGVSAKEYLGKATGKRQTFELTHPVKNGNIRMHLDSGDLPGANWELQSDMKHVTAYAVSGANISATYGWQSEMPEIHQISAVFSE